MIIITDTSSFTNLSTDNSDANILLTESTVNQELTGSAIINTTITNVIKDLLNDILSKTETLNIAGTISKLAGFSGFSIDESTNTIEFNSSNVNIDKLTFFIIFRLPYAHSSLEYEDPLPVSSALPGANDKKWGKYANYLRSVNGTGLEKINSAGEQVNASDKPVDDNNNEIDGWFSENAYNYLDVFPFNGSYNIPAGLNSAAVEKSMLFGQNNEQPNGLGELASDFSKIPLYFYLLSKVENPYSTLYWLNASKNSSTISRVHHWPASINTKNYRRHYVRILSNPSNIQVPNETFTLANDATGTYFNVTIVNVVYKLYIEELDSPSLNFEGLDLTNADEIEKKSDDELFAIWKNNYDNPVLSNNSGLTVGMGIDLGANMDGLYRIEINITISGTGTFRLYYGANRSPEINTTTNCNSLKDVIQDLIEDNGDRVRVENSSGGTSGSPSRIKITRQFGGNNIAYNHRIYVYGQTGTANITLTPTNEDDRWVEQSSVLNDHWYYFNQVLNYSFSNDPTALPSGDEFWVGQVNNLTVAEKPLLIKALKKSLGCRSKSGYHIWDENKDVIKKIEIKSYVRNLRASYHKFFIERFYNKERTLEDGSTAYNGRKRVNNTWTQLGYFSVQYLLEHQDLKTKPNQAELFAIVLLNYNYPQEYVRRFNELIEAINEHSIPKLKNALRNMTNDRKNALKNFIGDAVKLKLYHSIED